MPGLWPLTLGPGFLTPLVSRISLVITLCNRGFMPPYLVATRDPWPFLYSWFQSRDSVANSRGLFPQTPYCLPGLLLTLACLSDLFYSFCDRGPVWTLQQSSFHLYSNNASQGAFLVVSQCLSWPFTRVPFSEEDRIVSSGLVWSGMLPAFLQP